MGVFVVMETGSHGSVEGIHSASEGNTEVYC